MSNNLAHRLRELRDRRGWTVVYMAEKTGIPKRTLDKYMLRKSAILPGHDALLALSKGLGVSLDWIVVGADFVSEGSDLLADMAATQISKRIFGTFLDFHLRGEDSIFEGEEILGLSPEEWAAEVGSRTGEQAKKLAAEGVTVQELLDWKVARQERLAEIVEDRRIKKFGERLKTD